MFPFDNSVPENIRAQDVIRFEVMSVIRGLKSLTNALSRNMWVLVELYSFFVCMQASLDVTDSRGASRFGKSTSSFGQGGSFDFGSPRTSSVDGTSSPARAFERNGTNHSQDFDSFGAFGSLATSKNSNKTSLFGGSFSPKAAATPSLFGDSPRASNNSFLRFDSFGPGSPVAPPRPSG